jgi:putative SOS response-associated peptidase YedK
MCGRFALISDLSVIQEEFNIREVSFDVKAGWNVTPGQNIPAVIHLNDHNCLVSFFWGFIPSWSKDPVRHRSINARAETVDKKPSFKDAFSKRRCLIVIDGFYEWKRDDKKKIPLYFHLKSGRPFGLAGLYETWISPDQKPINTCTIITTEANQLIQLIHNRMPVIIPKDQERIWMDKDVTDQSFLLSTLKPYPSDEMDYKTGIGPNFI